MMLTYNSSTHKAEARGLHQVQGQPRLHSEFKAGVGYNNNNNKFKYNVHY